MSGKPRILVEVRHRVCPSPVLHIVPPLLVGALGIVAAAVALAALLRRGPR